jgi:hypothetical protein
MDNNISAVDGSSSRIAGLGIGTFFILVGFFICLLSFLVTPLVKAPGILMASVSFCYLGTILYLLNAPKTSINEVRDIV